MWIPYIEMFSGIGGVRLGLEKANQSRSEGENGQNPTGLFTEQNSDFRPRNNDDSRQRIRQTPAFHCVWANDIDKYACQVYRKNFGDKELVEGDIRTIDTNTIPDHNLLTAGFPCPSFSLAGKRKGFEDTRGTLFYEIARIARVKRPKLLLLENVKGILSNDEGRTFAKILQTLDELGYDVEWQVLNSKHFGVPQNRERVFIVGHSRTEPTKQIFPIGESDSVPSPNEKDGQGVTSCLDANYYKGARRQRTFVLQEHSFSGAEGRGRGIRTYEDRVPTLTQQMGTGENNVPMVVADRTRSYANKGRNLESPKRITNALSGVQKDNLVLAVETAHTKANMKEGQFSKECHSLDGGKSKAVMIANTLCDGWLMDTHHHSKPMNQYRIRRLTPIECERLQGFPDGWTEGVSDTQRYKLLGNAVTTNVIEFLGQRLSSLFCV